MFPMSLNGEIPLSGIFSVSSSVNTDSYWPANASAFAIAVVNSLLWYFNVGMQIWSHLLLLIKDQRFLCYFLNYQKDFQDNCGILVPVHFLLLIEFHHIYIYLLLSLFFSSIPPSFS